MLDLIEKELGYLAGITDGEGYIGIYQIPDGHFRLSLTITNTNHDLLEWLSTKIGYQIFEHEGNKPGHKDYFKISINGERCQELLEMMKELLIVKRPQCEVALQFPVGARTEGEQLQQALCYIKMRELNKRGK